MKTQIVLPDGLMADLRKAVPNRHRSHFIAEAVERRLKALRVKNVLRETAGAWTDARHPDLRTSRGVNDYLGRFRARLGRRG